MNAADGSLLASWLHVAPPYATAASLLTVLSAFNCSPVPAMH
jgi:hypothetical protein